MSYGSASNDSVYEDSVNYFDSPAPEPAETPEAAPVPQFDPSKFVDAEKYQQLEGQFNQLKTGLSQALGVPGQNTVSEEDRLAKEWLDNNLKDRGFLTQQDFAEQQQLSKVEDWGKSKGFEGGTAEIDGWFHYTHAKLSARANRGDAKSAEIANKMSTFYNNKQWVAAAQYLDGALDKSYFPQQNSQPQMQQMGHSFGNNPFPSSSSSMSPEAMFGEIQKAYAAGDTQKAQQMQEQMRQVIRGMQ